MMRRSGCRRAGDGMGWDVIKGGRRSLKSEAGRSHFWAAKWPNGATSPRKSQSQSQRETGGRDEDFCGRTSAQGIADCWLGLRVENVLVTSFSLRAMTVVKRSERVE